MAINSIVHFWKQVILTGKLVAVFSTICVFCTIRVYIPYTYGTKYAYGIEQQYLFLIPGNSDFHVGGRSLFIIKENTSNQLRKLLLWSIYLATPQFVWH